MKLNDIAVVLTIIVAIIAIATFLAGLWGPPDLSKSSTSTPTPTPPPTPTSTPTGDADLRAAEKLAGDWVNAIENREIDTVINMADTPFYFDQEILVSIGDLEAKYEDWFSAMEERDRLQISSLKAMKVSEYQALLDREGYGGGDRILSSLRLNDNDIVVIIVSEGGEGLIIVFRIVNDDIRMAGFWD